MQCPKCRSRVLMIRQKVGVERLMNLLTGLRKYRCVECGTFFRAPDRRRTPREEPAGGLSGDSVAKPVA
jgi:DNA-directed RNA polymerase subunit RPC12/RpoP